VIVFNGIFAVMTVCVYFKGVFAARCEFQFSNLLVVLWYLLLRVPMYVACIVSCMLDNSSIWFCI